jgi:SAM-dependent methyltransferase
MSDGRRTAPEDWRDYLAGFHAERPGITEDLLSEAIDDAGRTPYHWLAEVVPPGARVLDVACGSAPTGELLQAASYLGLDLSRDELRLGAARGLEVAQADAGRLPVADAAVDVVVCSMALQLLPLEPALAEVRRVLRPGGAFAATVPTSGPMPARDALHWGRVLLALRVTGVSYPNDDALAFPGDRFAAAGLALLSDESRGFGLDVATERVADRLLDGLYLPDVPPARVAAARRAVRGWVGRRTTVPVRRLVARG